MACFRDSKKRNFMIDSAIRDLLFFSVREPC